MHPGDRRYSEDHEWLKIENEKRAKIGITQFAQKELGDVVFVELPEEGASVSVNDSFAVVESVKAVSDIYAPVAGRIVEVNSALADRPELINEDPYGEGWIAVIEMTDPSQVEALMTAEQYQEHVGE